MSVLGQKQTYTEQNAMSALPPKADMCGATRDVCFGPKADVGIVTVFQEVTRARVAKSP